MILWVQDCKLSIMLLVLYPNETIWFIWMKISVSDMNIFFFCWSMIICRAQHLWILWWQQIYEWTSSQMPELSQSLSIAKPFLISFKQTLGQSTKYWPKTNYKSIQQHFKNIHRTEVRHLPDKVRSMFNLSIFVHIWHNSGTDTGRHADIQFL